MWLFLEDFNICASWNISNITVFELWIQGSLGAFFVFLGTFVNDCKNNFWIPYINWMSLTEDTFISQRNQHGDIYVLLADKVLTSETPPLMEYLYVFRYDSFCLDWHGVWVICTHLVNMRRKILLGKNVTRKKKIQISVQFPVYVLGGEF